MPIIKIDRKNIGDGRTFVIAEITGSHSGSVKKIKKLIDIAKNSGADAIKLQKYKAKNLVVKKIEYYDLLKSLEIDDNFWPEIVSYALNKKIPMLVDIFESKDSETLSELGVSGFKIHTTDINNLKLIKKASKEDKPIFLAVGASTRNEIETAIETVLRYNEKLILMHGFQCFPTPIEENKLGLIDVLKKTYHLNVGFLDHTEGGSIESMVVPLISVARGASVIEKHITIDRELKEPDYQSALNPDEFKYFVSLLRKIEKITNNSSFQLSNMENDYANNVKKRIIAKNKLPMNKKIKEGDLCFKRAPEGLFISELEKVIGNKPVITLKPDDPITHNVLKD
jgi:sialic acid synthase SpsE